MKGVAVKDLSKSLFAVLSAGFLVLTGYHEYKEDSYKGKAMVLECQELSLEKHAWLQKYLGIESQNEEKQTSDKVESAPVLRAFPKEICGDDFESSFTKPRELIVTSLGEEDTIEKYDFIFYYQELLDYEAIDYPQYEMKEGNKLELKRK